MLLLETALGTCAVRWSENGITEVLMPRTRALGGRVQDGWSDIPASIDIPVSIREAGVRIVALLDGVHENLRSIVLDECNLDPFRRGVYAAAREIPPGATSSYGEIAKAIGQPDAARAVGAALGANPFPIVVPCHRVLAANGDLHGFSAPGGIATKRRMLEIERAPGFTQQALFV